MIINFIILAAMDLLPEVFEPAFAQRALLAAVFVAIAGGVIGSWIVLHDLAFFAHATAAGAYPLVALAPAGAVATEFFSFAGALIFAGAFFLIARRTGERDLTAGVLLTAFLAVGAILQHSYGGGRSAETLFFGSALTVDIAALLTLNAAGSAGLAIASVASGRWTMLAFDRRFEGIQAFALVVAIALLVSAALPSLGVLLVAALGVVPAATARLYCGSIRSLVMTSVVIGLATAIGGLWLALELDLPPGAAVATFGFGLFAAAAVWRAFPIAAARPVVASLAVVAILAGCGDKKSTVSAAPFAVASTPIVADLARAVAGRGLQVRTLLEPGSDPHHYEPRPSDLADLADARVILRSGGDIDAWLHDAIEASGSDRRPVDLSTAAVLLEHNGAINPHWFLDPSNVIAALDRLRIELTKAAPEFRETYRANAHRIETDYRRFDLWARDCLRSVPRKQRSFVAGHNAFDYLAARYAVTVPARISTGNVHTEPSAEAVARTVRVIRNQDVPVVAVVRGEANGVARQIALESGAKLVELHGDTLSDATRSLLDVQYDDVQRLATAMGATKRCDQGG